jgi:hypothetical protein
MGHRATTGLAMTSKMRADLIESQGELTVL